METMTLSQIAGAVGSHCDSDAKINEICIDTRAIKPGCLFVAIRGENFDGHDFIEQAYESGAVGVITSREISGHTGVILVPDTRKALLDLARYYRVQRVHRGCDGQCRKNIDQRNDLCHFE